MTSCDRVLFAKNGLLLNIGIYSYVLAPARSTFRSIYVRFTDGPALISVDLHRAPLSPLKNATDFIGIFGDAIWGDCARAGKLFPPSPLVGQPVSPALRATAAKTVMSTNVNTINAVLERTAPGRSVQCGPCARCPDAWARSLGPGKTRLTGAPMKHFFCQRKTEITAALMSPLFCRCVTEIRGPFSWPYFLFIGTGRPI